MSLDEAIVILLKGDIKMYKELYEYTKDPMYLGLIAEKESEVKKYGK